MKRLLTAALLASMCSTASGQLVTEIKPGAEFAFPRDRGSDGGIVVDDVVWGYSKRLESDGNRYGGTKTLLWYDKPKYSPSQKEYVIFNYSARPYAYIVDNEERRVEPFNPLRKKAIEECRLAVASEDLRSVNRNTQMFRVKKKVTLFRWDNYDKRFEPDLRETWLMEPVPAPKQPLETK